MTFSGLMNIERNKMLTLSQLKPFHPDDNINIVRMKMFTFKLQEPNTQLMHSSTV